MPIFAAASRGALVQLTCPKCGELQARARGAMDQEYDCRKCGAVFTRREGERDATQPSGRSRRKDR